MKTITYETGSSDQDVIEAYQANGATDTAAYLAAIEAIMAPRLGSTGEGQVSNAQELSQWVGQLVSYAIENSNIIRGV
jgi:hypothetical protein